MGKGTKRKTVWRTFSFENGYTNGNDATDGSTTNNHSTDGKNLYLYYMLCCLCSIFFE